MNNKLQPHYNGRVLANESAMKDPVVIAALEAMQQRDWEELKAPTGNRWYISDRH